MPLIGLASNLYSSRASKREPLVGSSARGADWGATYRYTARLVTKELAGQRCPIEAVGLGLSRLFFAAHSSAARNREPCLVHLC
jgi:hypothetical protein